jgi:hypothetical protein
VQELIKRSANRGGEFSEGNLRRGESSSREIFVEGNLRGGECSFGRKLVDSTYISLKSTF